MVLHETDWKSEQNENFFSVVSENVPWNYFISWTFLFCISLNSAAMHTFTLIHYWASNTDSGLGQVI